MDKSIVFSSINEINSKLYYNRNKLLFKKIKQMKKNNGNNWFILSRYNDCKIFGWTLKNFNLQI